MDNVCVVEALSQSLRRLDCLLVAKIAERSEILPHLSDFFPVERYRDGYERMSHVAPRITDWPKPTAQSNLTNRCSGNGPSRVSLPFEPLTRRKFFWLSNALNVCVICAFAMKSPRQT